MKSFLVSALSKLAQPSSWAGIAGALLLLHLNVDPGLWQHGVDVGIAAASFAAYLLNEKTSA